MNYNFEIKNIDFIVHSDYLADYFSQTVFFRLGININLLKPHYLQIMMLS